MTETIRIVKHPLDKNRKATDFMIATDSKISEKAEELYAIIETLPRSPERTLALRKVEEAVMWSNKANYHYIVKSDPVT